MNQRLFPEGSVVIKFSILIIKKKLACYRADCPNIMMQVVGSFISLLSKNHIMSPSRKLNKKESGKNLNFYMVSKNQINQKTSKKLRLRVSAKININLFSLISFRKNKETLKNLILIHQKKSTTNWVKSLLMTSLRPFISLLNILVKSMGIQISMIRIQRNIRPKLLYLPLLSQKKKTTPLASLLHPHLN